MRRLAFLGMTAVLPACQFDASGLASFGDAGRDDTRTAADAAAVEVDGSPRIADASPGADEPSVDAAAATALRKPITIAGGTVGETLVDFPLLVTVRDPDLRTGATRSGGDIYFTGADGVTVLDHEIERWRAASGQLVAWVRVPALSAGEETVLYLHYGDAARAPAENAAGVFSGDFSAVWHLADDPADGVAEALGSAPGTALGGVDASSLVTGTIGDGLRFDGDDDEVTFDNPLTGSTLHTISAWVRQEQSSDGEAMVVLGTGACGRARWFHASYQEGTIATGFYCDDWDDIEEDIRGDGWKLVHWVYGPAPESRLFIDGQLVDEPHEHSGDPVTEGNVGRLANAPAAFGQDMGLQGDLDEVRISDVPRPAAWIAAEFANQSDPASFYTLGSEQPAP